MVTIAILYYLYVAIFPVIMCRDGAKEYMLYEVTSFNTRERAALYNIYVKEHHIYFLNGVTNEAALPMDIVVDSRSKNRFEKKLLSNDIQYTHVPYKPISQTSIDEYEQRSTEDINNFLDYNDILAWVSKKAKLHPNLGFFVIANTYEKRRMYVLKLSTGVNKLAVFIMGGEEGRDWVTPPIILNFLNHILEDPMLNVLLNYYDFYFLPVFNPDGYSYTRTKDRFWSKNRKTYFPERMCSETDYTAVGVNVDRNWYAAESVPYITESECNGVYIGHKSFSEEESKALQFILNKIAVRLIAFINVRGFEKLITIPYAHTAQHCINHALLVEMLSSVTENLKRKHNATYFYGNSARFLYNFTGNCADWVKSNLNIPIVYTIYMQYQESFLPDTSHIGPLTEQFITIMNETLLLAKDLYGPLFNKDIIHSPHFSIVTLLITVALFGI